MFHLKNPNNGFGKRMKWNNLSLNNKMRNTDQVTYNASNHSENENEPEVNNEMQLEIDEKCCNI